MNIQAYPDIPRIWVPTKYNQKATMHNRRYLSLDSFRTRSCFSRPTMYSQGTSQAASLFRVIGLTAWRHLKIWIPALRPGSSKQRAYEQYRSVFSELLGPDPNGKSLLDHEDDSECFDISEARLPELRAVTSRLYAWPQLIRFYCVARMRSRFSRCCWKAIHCHFLLDHFEELLDLLSNPRECPSLCKGNLDIIAWVLRSDHGHQGLLFTISTPIFRYRGQNSIKSKDFDELETMWILLFFESGFDIGTKRPIEPGKPPW
jgi:hypothetical protein